MRITLRSLVLALAVLAAVGFTSKTASAANVRVPFNFNVNGMTLPAGTYTVLRDHTGNVVTLASEDAKFAYSWLLVPGDPAPNSTKVTLRFDEVAGGPYMLRDVQYNSKITKRLDKKISEVRAIHIVSGQ
jgi:hypothetical protein